MTRPLVICPRGHQTDPAGASVTANGSPACPVCGESTRPVSQASTLEYAPAADANATVPPGSAATTPGGDAWQTLPPLSQSGTKPDENATLPPTHPPGSPTGSTVPPSLGLMTGSAAGESNPVVTVSGYEIRRILGRGSMGVVYKARQVKLNRTVALKMVLAGGHASSDERARFQKEAEALASLQHPNIIQVYEVGEAEGMPFFSMEFLPGGTLEKLTQGGAPIDPKKAAEIVEKLARAMAVAHQRGIVHRDLKPANVLLTADGEPKVTDFGLAKRLDDAGGPSGATQTGTAMGTPSYMAPEQAEGRIKEIGPAADVYALGAILYELLTGRPPFKGMTAVDTMLMVVTEEAVSPTRLQPRLPRDIATICLKCIQKPIPKRYASALDLADDLRRFQNGEPIKAVPVSNWERARKWVRRRPATAALLGFSAAACVALLAVGVWFHLELRASMRETEDEKKVAVRRLARLYVAQGMTYADRGDIPLALPFLIEALKLEHGDPEREELDRMRLAAVLKYTPRLLRVGFHQQCVNDVAFSPDGRYAFSASGDGTVHVWAGSPEDPLSIHASHLHHGAGVNRAAFSRDSTRLVTAGKDGKARVWACETGQPGATFDHGADVRCAQFDVTGAVALTAGADGVVKQWDTATGRAARPDVKHGKDVLWAAYSPDGDRLVTAGTGMAKLWNAKTGEPVGPPFHAGADVVLYAEFSPDGKRVVTAGGDNFARQWAITPAGARPTGRDMPHTEDVLAARFNATGTRIATGSADGTARIWDTDGNPLGQSMWHNSVVNDVAFSPDGTAVITSSDDNTARVWDAATGLPRGPRLAHCGAVNRAVFSPSSKYVLTGSQAGLSRLYRRLDSFPKIVIAAPEPPIRANVRSRDGKWEAVWGPNNTVRVLAAADRSPAGPEIKLKGNVFTADFSPDGSRLVTANDMGSAVIWNVATAELAVPPLRHSSAVYSAAFGPDGTKVVTGSDDNTARVWDAATGDPLGQPMRHDATVNKAVFDPTGRIVLTSSSDGAARAWDYTNGEPLTPSLDTAGWAGDALRRPFDPKAWDLPVERRPLKTLALEAHWLSGHTVDKSGVIVSSDVDTLREIWDEVEKHHPELLKR